MPIGLMVNGSDYCGTADAVGFKGWQLRDQKEIFASKTLPKIRIIKGLLQEHSY